MKPSDKKENETMVILAMDHLGVIAHGECPEELAAKLKALYRADSVFVGDQHVVVNRGCLSAHLKKQVVKARA